MFTVEEIMTKNPIACEVGTPVRDVARLMKDNKVGSVVVLRDGKVAGFITDRMITTHCVADGKDGDSLVDDIMLKDPAKLHKDESVFAALDTMRSAGVVRRVPVVNTYNELEGVVSIGDVAAVTQRLLDGILLDESHDALDTTRVLTGAKDAMKTIRSPTRQHRIPPGQETYVTRQATPVDKPPRKGNVRRRDRRGPSASAADQQSKSPWYMFGSRRRGGGGRRTVTQETSDRS